MSIGKEIIGEAIGSGFSKKLKRLEAMTNDVADVAASVDRATADWTKDGTISRLEPAERVDWAATLKSIQGNLDKIATLAEIFQREVLPRLAGKGAKS